MARIFRETNADGLIECEATIEGGDQDSRPKLLSHARQIANGRYLLDLPHSQIVLAAIRETCDFRRWELLAAHVRSTHVHLVADGFSDPDRTITDPKAYASRALKRQTAEPHQSKYWARGGSTRALFAVESVNAAIKYVVDQQGSAMAVYTSDRG